MKRKSMAKAQAEILARMKEPDPARQIYELGVQAGTLLRRNDRQAREALKRNLERARELGVMVGKITPPVRPKDEP